MMFWLGVALLLTAPLVVLLLVAFLMYRLWVKYIPFVYRVFQEKPLFIVPRGRPAPDAESLRIPTAGGQALQACYLKSKGRRRGVILFGLEFGSHCWASHSYCARLLDAGYDVLAFEPRSQGESDAIPGYEPLQWVTEHEAEDTRAAIAYLKSRPDADPFGIGFFGISKGAGAGLIAGADDPYVLCFVTDGVFATQTTVVPYMLRFFRVHNTVFPRELLEDWFLKLLCRFCLWRLGRERGCRFSALEPVMARLSPRPLLMIHGENDGYIKAEMARSLFSRAREPKELWMVEGAGHNQALHVAGDEYTSRVVAFFDKNLGGQRVGLPAREGELAPAGGAA
jgi:pimeloyl-ACP methyl ester carboxylesterase